jgi:hypothetical protein
MNFYLYCRQNHWKFSSPLAKDFARDTANLGDYCIPLMNTPIDSVEELYKRMRMINMLPCEEAYEGAYIVFNRYSKSLTAYSKNDNFNDEIVIEKGT